MCCTVADFHIGRLGTSVRLFFFVFHVRWKNLILKCGGKDGKSYYGHQIFFCKIFATCSHVSVTLLYGVIETTQFCRCWLLGDCFIYWASDVSVTWAINIVRDWCCLFSSLPQIKSFCRHYAMVMGETKIHLCDIFPNLFFLLLTQIGSIRLCLTDWPLPWPMQRNFSAPEMLTFSERKWVWEKDVTKRREEKREGKDLLSFTSLFFWKFAFYNTPVLYICLAWHMSSECKFYFDSI